MSPTQQAVSSPGIAPAAASLAEIRTRPCPNCALCGSPGERLYLGLRDKLFGASGTWNLKKCRNKLCGHLWLDPMPLHEDIGKAYDTYYTHSDLPAAIVEDSRSRRFIRSVKKHYLAWKFGYSREKENTRANALGLFAYLTPFRRSLLDFSVMYLPFRPGGRLLEVGCGSGRMLKDMENLGWQVEGIDFDAAAVRNCRRKGLSVYLGGLEDGRYAEDSFDAVVMSHLIEHVPDPLSLIRATHRILKPGGYLVAVTPNCQSLGHMIYRRNWRGLEPPRHVHIFSLHSLNALARKEGFRMIKATTTIRDASGYLTASQSLRRTGSHQPGGAHSRTAHALQFLEWVLIHAGIHAGEELALVARKCETA